MKINLRALEQWTDEQGIWNCGALLPSGQNIYAVRATFQRECSHSEAARRKLGRKRTN